MAQATFSVRMDEALKREFDSLCQDFGMNTTTAINVFARAVVRERRIPFEIFSPQAVVTREGAMQAFSALRAQARENGISNMTMDEINEEIRQYREEAEK
ncbi:MAG: type II toxin-antitoxin system RelB/DinJ family antitoxin [Lachnospiraceae bacterium]|jgi:addiction module antitoxin, relB/dinJ family|nr:type II toxin-antitoxin system RelB/DinJ family antitoxin [Lachnospiraceae bacterium]MBF1016113.1 type II toxin-antitoxin system RelB/DinJ family antitoxin [Lachnospiraceae bacterium]MBF1019673.1 type II toxin-antitoxin system RelB/DinJ family antitoxin [Lachnospiraceae bacterium]